MNPGHRSKPEKAGYATVENAGATSRHPTAPELEVMRSLLS